MQNELRVVIAGGRTYSDYGHLSSVCDNIINAHGYNKENITIVSGNAIGTDRMGERYANERGYKLTVFPAKWFELGRRAGIVRNIQMGDYAVSDNSHGILIAFWNGESRGTEHMIDTAHERNMDVFIESVNY